MKTVLKILGKALVILLKLILCLLFTLFFIGSAFIISCAKQQGWQIAFYIVFSLLMIPGLWAVFFIKTNKIIKFIYAFLIVFHLYAQEFLPTVKHQYDIDGCYDDGNYWDHVQDKCIIRDKL